MSFFFGSKYYLEAGPIFVTAMANSLMYNKWYKTSYRAASEVTIMTYGHNYDHFTKMIICWSYIKFWSYWHIFRYFFSLTDIFWKFWSYFTVFCIIFRSYFRGQFSHILENSLLQITFFAFPRFYFEKPPNWNLSAIINFLRIHSFLLCMSKIIVTGFLA